VKVLLPIHGQRIAPVFDVARRFLVAELGSAAVAARSEVSIAAEDPVAKTRALLATGASVIICGAISRPLERLLSSAGLRVISNTCGALDEVLAAYVARRLGERAFLMPGCGGRQRRRRRRGGR
jgi:predicted Fe-Mo cluster-binding NifX family protein